MTRVLARIVVNLYPVVCSLMKLLSSVLSSLCTILLFLKCHIYEPFLSKVWKKKLGGAQEKGDPAEIK